MKIRRTPFFAFKDNAVKVAIASESDITLIEKSEYEKYCWSEPHAEYGGHYSESPVYLNIPKTGEWIVLIDSKPNTALLKLIIAL